MKEVSYYFDRPESENLKKYLDFNKFLRAQILRNGSEHMKELGLIFPMGEEYCKHGVYAFAYIENERAYMLAKIKYGI